MHLPNVATLIVGHCIYAVTHAIGVLPPPNVQPAQPAFSSWNVLGDSFTAGPNAGQPVDPQSPNCYRTDGSWAYQLRRDPHFFNQNNLGGFQMHACTGDTIAQVREGQVDASNSGFTWLNDLYTITVGGNDLRFSSIVKSCVYNLPSIAGGGSCSGLLDAASQALKEGSPFLLDLDDLYRDIQDKAGAKARLLVVPYVSFYNYGTEKHETKDNCWYLKILARGWTISPSNSTLRSSNMPLRKAGKFSTPTACKAASMVTASASQRRRRGTRGSRIISTRP